MICLLPALTSSQSQPFGGKSMDHLLSALPFAGLLAAQFLAVVVVSGERSEIESSGRRVSYDELRDRNIRRSS